MKNKLEKLQKRISEQEQLEAYLVALINNREEAIWSVDNNYNFVIINNFFAKTYFAVYHIELKTGMNALEILSPELLLFWKPKYDAVLNGKNIIFEFSETVADKQHYYEVKLSPVFIGDKIKGVSAISTDIMERKKEEEVLLKTKEKLQSLNEELASQNEEYLALNEELNESMERVQKINIELKQAIDKAKENEEKFKSLFDNLGDAIFVIKHSGIDKGQILEANAAAIQQTGYSRDELLQLNIFKDISIPGLVMINADDLEERINTGEKVITIGKKRRKDRTEYWTEITITPVIFKGEKAAISVNHDITDRKQFQEKIVEQSLRLFNILEGTNAGTWDWNVQTGGLLLNERWADIIGYSLKELEPININTWINNVHPSDLPTANKALEKLFEKEIDYYDVEFRQPHKNGGWVWVNARGKVVEWTKDGRPLQVSGIHVDITERKLGEQQLQEINEELATQNEEYMALNEELTESLEHIQKMNIKLEKARYKAEESERLKTAFLHNMSHEMRTPMNGILGFSDLLKEPGLSGDRQQEYIDIIKKSGYRMLNTIDDLMKIARIESGHEKPEISEVNVNEQIEMIYAFFKPEAEKKGLQLRVNQPNLIRKVIIKTDKEKLYAVLANLVKNAIKYTPEGFVEFGYDEKEDQLNFFVKDSGIGIPKNRRKAIFDRFVQADIEDRKVYEGIGLGLSISKSYVEMLGGKIWVEAEEGVGSQFYFTISAHKKKKTKSGEEVKNPEVTHKKDLKKLNVLIVEDEETSDTYLTIVMKQNSKKVFHAQNGVEAVEICRNNPDLDLVLMDIKMPVMGGYEATGKIRKFNKELIIIAQTAFGFPNDRNKAIEAGCNDYISKPIRRNELLGIVAKYFTDNGENRQGGD